MERYAEAIGKGLNVTEERVVAVVANRTATLEERLESLAQDVAQV